MNTSTLTQLERAEKLLQELLQDRERVTVVEARAAAEQAGISFGTLSKARHRLGIAYVKNGPYKSFWGKPVQGQP